ncbi:SRPBCC family protein [Halopenitus sp. H-Gu1]|uniref:SRPBCC family protein n=1 Tax=Halopenitus sp. H-Gu1 TaxID=3242697 RepID=UPI00359DD60D
MPTYRRRTRIAAPLERVWEFHSRVEGLTALTPDWMNLRIDSVVGPDGERDLEILEEGTRIRMSLHPFGIGPRRGWTSHIRRRRSNPGRAYFIDDMEEGPLPRWEHTHLFFADGDETVLVDDLEYRMPIGIVTDRLDPLVQLGFEAMFRDRHRKTGSLLEETGDETS